MSSYSVQTLQEKLNRLTLSQDSIETLSLWVIHHRDHAKTSVAVWLDSLQKGTHCLPIPDQQIYIHSLLATVLNSGRILKLSVEHMETHEYN